MIVVTFTELEKGTFYLPESSLYTNLRFYHWLRSISRRFSRETRMFELWLTGMWLVRQNLIDILKLKHLPAFYFSSLHIAKYGVEGLV